LTSPGTQRKGAEAITEKGQHFGALLLAGGAEFGGRMAEPDLRAIELAGGFDAPICIIPAAAAPDHHHDRAGANGLRWFRGLGASDVAVAEVIDRASAADPAIVASLNRARLIYLLGGFPHHLDETLADSPAWKAALRAHADGAVIAGSSAGAMVLCEHYYDPYEKELFSGLNLIPRSCVLPHHNNFGRGWAASLSERLPDSILIGIDEQTAMISDGSTWRVYGVGAVTIYRRAQRPQTQGRGMEFTL